MSLVWAITILDAASGAEMPTLVRDLNPYGAYPAEITVVGEKVFFASADGEHGDELWCYDGTRSARVADLQEGPGDFQPADLVVLGSRVYFHGGVTGRERELWTSDGTTVGTRLVTAWEGEATRIVSMRSNGRLLFLCVNSPASGGTPFQLWVSDGTAAGTRQVPVDGVDSFEVIAPTFVGDKCYFTSGIGCRLWVTDGSAANTHELAASINPGRGDLVRTTNGLVFFAWDELWVSDGTSAGTRPLEVNPGAAGSFPFNLIPLGEKVVFFADDGSHGFEPWITDGTAAGTRLLRDVAAGSSSGISPNSYFIDATLTVRDTVPDLIGSAGSRAFFSNSSESEGWELWSTDGSGEGTVRVVDLLPGAAGSAPLGFTTLGNRIVFVATGPGRAGRELWISDGTAAGTKLLADLAPGAEESRPAGFAPYRNGLVFRAYDGDGTKLWFTDGTTAGSRVLDNRFSNSYGGSYAGLTSSGERLFFNFSDDGGETIHLGTSDGTAAGTRRVYGPIPTAVDPDSVSWTSYTLFPIGRGEVLWTPWAEGLGTELWFSNGTFEGTGMLYDFSDETGWDASSPSGFRRLGDEIYFSAYVGLNRRSYFRFDAYDFSVAPAVMGADGSAALGGYAYVAPQMAGGRLFINRISGRRPPMDWRVYMSRPGETPVELAGLGSQGMYPSATGFTAYRGLNYFTVKRDGTVDELWRNDGTGSGNSRFAPNPNGEPFAVVSDRLLVLDGGALVSTDGTAAGTLRLTDAMASVALAADATRAFLIERGSEGESALWVTDGSTAGTQRVRGFERTAFYETTRGVLINGVLFFRARSEAAGAELWRSDGTADGTRMGPISGRERGTGPPSRLPRRAMAGSSMSVALRSTATSCSKCPRARARRSIRRRW